ncbi:hypothetical protein NP233_g1839 [Leucocoprinus birnbaumii]|uniref:Uncharacterized protein n=1 Tax=Leucocoprinus birnbaumii TaxID=56174 RepID=A0AAD5W061_9AGAR|nr:hypothetical protein NP233_g1839 [Leucocoprinus birnbaumii]
MSANANPASNAFPSFASHAARNPLQPVIQPAPPKNKKTYDKQTLEVNRQLREEKKDVFLADLEVVQLAHQERIKELAHKYHCKLPYMEKVVKSQSLYHRRRKANLWNAKVTKKGKGTQSRCVTRESMNIVLPILQEKPPGQHAKISEICRAIKDNPSLADMDPESDEAKALRDSFEETRALKKRRRDEMKALSYRTAADAFSFFSRSHVNDTMEPAWVGSSPQVLTFLLETMHTTAGEMGRHFELWSCTKGDGQIRNQLVKLQSECAEMIVQRLREITHCRNAIMSYAYYKTDIKARYNVELKGWPDVVLFRAPGKITTMFEIRALHAALLSGQCYWKVMPQGAVDMLTKKLMANPVRRTRKSRKRANDENAPPSGNVGGRGRGKKGNYKSREIIEEDDE